MKIAKEFSWEMGHRLPFHNGKCKHLHGHSYKCMVELTGDPDSNGMVMDYFDVKKIIAPIIDELDHSFMVSRNDKEVIEMLDKLNSRKVVVDFESTAENICLYLLNKVKSSNIPDNVKAIKVRVFETENTYAEDEIIF
ncbi:MAG: 6-carboxytetrahydropterin synthase [Ignavibacteriae bacterium HGW-Ignavibacteriae-3]|nr:MAG: 6-carboxytetrahydropterin synthase [Ignavibacteriae bacterium HGW-Ignavibacteriae-3]